MFKGIFRGFDIRESGSNLQDTFIQNHESALEPQNRLLIDRITKTEINTGNYIITRTKPIIVSALGAVLKSEGQLRPIHDFSLPER